MIIIGHTLYPRTPSTDIFVSKANQSIDTNAQRTLAFNALVRAGITGEDLVWDVSDAVDPFRTGYMPVTSDPFAASYTPCSFTGAISGTTLTVSAVASGSLNPGDGIYDPNTTGAPDNVIVFNTNILRQLTGTPGAAGTYTVSMPYGGAYPQKSNVSSRTLTTAGRNTRDGLHLQAAGVEIIVQRKCADLLGYLRGST